MVNTRATREAPAAKRARLEELEREREVLLLELGDTDPAAPAMTVARTETEAPTTSSTPVPLSSEDATNTSTSSGPPMEDILSRIERGVNRRSSTLPTFDGDSDQWEYFHAQFHRQTKEKNIPEHENMKRLSEALRGEAYTHVKKLLGKPDCLGVVMDELEQKFNLKEGVNQSLLRKCREVELVLPDDFHSLEAFAVDVAALKPLVQKVNNDTISEMAVDCLKEKLDGDAQRSWGARSRTGGSTFNVFQNWLRGYREDFKAGGGGCSNRSRKSKNRRSPDRERRHRSRSRDRENRRRNRDQEDDWRYSAKVKRFGRRHDHREDQHPYYRQAPGEKAERVLVTQYVNTVEDVCGLACADKHTLKACPVFANKTHPEKTEKIRNDRRCFGCLGLGHIARRCPASQVPKI